MAPEEGGYGESRESLSVVVGVEASRTFTLSTVFGAVFKKSVLKANMAVWTQTHFFLASASNPW